MAEGMHGGGTCVAGVGRHVWQGACMAGGMAGEMATAADGTYPPGMHSCSFFLQKMSCLRPPEYGGLLRFEFNLFRCTT